MLKLQFEDCRKVCRNSYSYDINQHAIFGHTLQARNTLLRDYLEFDICMFAEKNI